MEEPTGVRTWKPKTAGVFTVFCGVIGIWGSVRWMVHAYSMVDVFIGIALCMLGLVAVMGSIFAFRRRMWLLALSGAICALPGSLMSPYTLMSGPPLPPGAEYSPIWVWVLIIGIPLSVLAILAIAWIASSRQEFT